MGACCVWGLGEFLPFYYSATAVLLSNAALSGMLSGEKGSTPSRPHPCGFSRIVSHPYIPLNPQCSPTYRIQAVDGPDGVIDALTSAWDGRLGAGRLALAGWAGARRIFLMPLSIFLFPCSRMRVAASGAATWVLSRYIGPVRPQTLCR